MQPNYPGSGSWQQKAQYWQNLSAAPGPSSASAAVTPKPMGYSEAKRREMMHGSPFLLGGPSGSNAPRASGTPYWQRVLAERPADSPLNRENWPSKFGSAPQRTSMAPSSNNTFVGSMTPSSGTLGFGFGHQFGSNAGSTTGINLYPKGPGIQDAVSASLEKLRAQRQASSGDSGSTHSLLPGVISKMWR
jgi:hypothetical protein